MTVLKPAAFALLAGLSVLATSCASVQGFPERPESLDIILKQLNETYSTEAVLKAYDGKSTDEEKVAYRNEVIAARMWAIDISFAEYQKDIFSHRSSFVVGGDTLKFAMGAAGALTTAGQTSQILSGLAGSFDAASASVDTNVYNSQTQIAIMSTMRAERATVKLAIQENSKQDATRYPLTAALSDLNDYYMAGSFPGALAAIASTAGEKQAIVDAELEVANRLDTNLLSRLSSVSAAFPKIASMSDAEVSQLLNNPPEDSKVTTDILAEFSLPPITELSAKQSRFVLRQILQSLASSDTGESALSAWLGEIDDLAKLAR